MILDEQWIRYTTDLTDSFQKLKLPWLPGTPLGKVGTEIYEMIGSYLYDADSFRSSDDVVNEYAALTYAHGWLDAGLYLGYYAGISTISLYLPEENLIPSSYADRLSEKSLRYGRMLRQACKSVKISPETGSPMYNAAHTILKYAYDAGSYDDTLHDLGTAKALGRYSYGYGWLDTGVRSGLFQISANPDLFTTDSGLSLSGFSS